IHTVLSTLSLHDALPIWQLRAALGIAAEQLVVDDELERQLVEVGQFDTGTERRIVDAMPHAAGQLMQGPHGADGQLGGLAETLRSEEHTSELQSRENLVC